MERHRVVLGATRGSGIGPRGPFQKGAFASEFACALFVVFCFILISESCMAQGWKLAAPPVKLGQPFPLSMGKQLR